jgi:hypothetical protein
LGVFFSGQAAAVIFSFSSSQYIIPISINSSNTITPGFTKANSAANYYFWLTCLQPMIQETDENKEKGPADGGSSIDFQDVQFSYPLAPEKRVIKGLDLTVSVPRSMEKTILTLSRSSVDNLLPLSALPVVERVPWCPSLNASTIPQVAPLISMAHPLSPRLVPVFIATESLSFNKSPPSFLTVSVRTLRRDLMSILRKKLLSGMMH